MIYFSKSIFALTLVTYAVFQISAPNDGDVGITAITYTSEYVTFDIITRTPTECNTLFEKLDIKPLPVDNKLFLPTCWRVSDFRYRVMYKEGIQV